MDVDKEKKGFQFPQIPFGLLIVGAVAIFLFLPPDIRNKLSNLFSEPTALQKVQSRALDIPPNEPPADGSASTQGVPRFVIPPERIKRFDVYSPETATVDQELAANSAAYSAREIDAMAPLVAGRRVASMGRTSSNEIAEVVEIYADFQLRIERESSSGSKQSVRKLRNRRLAEACGRISLKEMEEVMQELDQQLATQQKTP